MKKIILSLVLTMAFAFSANAQLILEGNWLRFNGARYNNTYNTTWTGWAHAWVNGTKVLKLDLGPADPRLATSTDKICFLDGDRGVWNDIYARNYYNYSDAVAKTNVQSISSATKTLLGLRPVFYQWKDQTAYSQFKTFSSYSTNPKEIGFIAQEVEKILPDLIGIDSEGNKLVNYIGIIPILTSAIQELNARIESLEKQLNGK